MFGSFREREREREREGKNVSKSTHSIGATLVYCYILTSQTPKSCSSSGAKSIFFSSIAIVYIYR